jgi:predicted house-cleaning NTP pyrophosphatase (Maf/HAM1 superfamily)
MLGNATSIGDNVYPKPVNPNDALAILQYTVGKHTGYTTDLWGNYTVYGNVTSIGDNVYPKPVNPNDALAILQYTVGKHTGYTTDLWGE